MSKKWILCSVGSVIVGLACLGGYMYWRLEPARHFEDNHVPVLATPTKADPVSNSVLEPLSITSSSPIPANSSIPISRQEKEIQSFNVLVLGIDARGEEDSRADVIMVVHVIPSEKKANIISLPRDTRVFINGVGYTKINHAHILGEQEGGNRGGTEEMLQVVSDFLEIPINYYVKTNFTGFVNFIDSIGGVDITVEQSIHLRSDHSELAAGQQHLDGQTALSLVRERWAFPEGDFGRQNEQSKILKSVAEKLLAPEHIIETTALMAQLRKDIIDTNLEDSDLLSLLRMLKGMKKEDFQYIQIPGKGGYNHDPLVNAPLYFWNPDMEQVKQIEEKYLQ